MKKMRILIVDDHAIVRAGIRSLLEGEEDLEVVGEAARGDEAVEKALLLDPELVLMDIAMPGISGIEATRRLKEELPYIHVLILTMHDDEEFLLPVLRAGALGYVLKDTEPQQLLHAIRCAGDGQPFLSPAVAKYLLGAYVAMADNQEGEKYNTLSPREKEVVQLVASGQSNREIAKTLILSARTIEKHRQTAMRKLGLSSYDDLVKYAVLRGLTDPESNLT